MGTFDAVPPSAREPRLLDGRAVDKHSGCLLPYIEPRDKKIHEYPHLGQQVPTRGVDSVNGGFWRLIVLEHFHQGPLRQLVRDQKAWQLS